MIDICYIICKENKIKNSRWIILLLSIILKSILCNANVAIDSSETQLNISPQYAEGDKKRYEITQIISNIQDSGKIFTSLTKYYVTVNVIGKIDKQFIIEFNYDSIITSDSAHEKASNIFSSLKLLKDLHIKFSIDSAGRLIKILNFNDIIKKTINFNDSLQSVKNSDTSKLIQTSRQSITLFHNSDIRDEMIPSLITKDIKIFFRIFGNSLKFNKFNKIRTNYFKEKYDTTSIFSKAQVSDSLLFAKVRELDRIDSICTIECNYNPEGSKTFFNSTGDIYTFFFPSFWIKAFYSKIEYNTRLFNFISEYRISCLEN